MPIKDPLDAAGIAVFVPIVAFVLTLAWCVVSDSNNKKSSQISVSPYAATFEHDGHRFIRPRSSNFIMHHPDCQCQRAEASR